MTGTWPIAFEVTYLYFCEKGSQVPRGWTRTTVKREDLVHYKYAPHHAEELREYDYTVYVESVPSLTTTTLAGAITTALSTGASVALPTRSVVTDLTSSPGHLRVKHIDLAAMLFKAQYLDRKNMTFIVRRYERGKRLAAGRRRPGNRPQGAGSMVAADGALAELIARKVGKGRAREIHGHGPLVFHL